MSRELDEKLAKALGWREGYIAEPLLPPLGQSKPSYYDAGGFAVVPHYSTSGDAMLELIEEMGKRGWRLDVTYSEPLGIIAGEVAGGCDAKFSCKSQVRGRFPAEAESMPEAVALAALSALEGKV